MDKASCSNKSNPNDQEMAQLLNNLLPSIDTASEVYAREVCPNLELGILSDCRAGITDGSVKLLSIREDVAKQAESMAKVLPDAIQLAEYLQKEDPGIATVSKRLNNALSLTKNDPTSVVIARSFGDVCALCAAAEMFLVTRNPERNVLPYDSRYVFGSYISEEDHHSPAEIAWCYIVKYNHHSLFENVKDPDSYVPFYLGRHASKRIFDYNHEIEALEEDGDLPALRWAAYGLKAEGYADVVERLGFANHEPRTSCLYASVPKQLRLARWDDPETSTVSIWVSSAVAAWVGKCGYAIVSQDSTMRIEVYTYDNYLAKLASLVGTRVSVRTNGHDVGYNAWDELAHANECSVNGDSLSIPASVFSRAGFVSNHFIELDTSPDRMSLIISPRMPS